ncbi:hypothetical protein K461DRAFT_286045 [Myriangium duriaei CBS 260.36]|uniref:F-box domain-containing protein n=1 Tax=Myriangium duriaei CBS 260.36 TaxID=1168546 RepID=A0A9P4J363_9PEZI|nr:hypothetical protein K461DRAFT_286045 [Myriangium duriaei CBS 260.36]
MDTTHTTLPDLLANHLILLQLTPYLPLPSLLSLSSTSTSLRSLLLTHPSTFSHLDLSPVPSARLPASLTAPLDRGGQSFRAERMDEALTEDEFYCGPLRGIFSRLTRIGALAGVGTMVLDGLCVPADLVREIVADTERFKALRVLSLRRCEHLNERKLCQVLKYAVRPGRAEGTPRLRALYVFGPRDGDVGSGEVEVGTRGGGVTEVEGAQIGAMIGAHEVVGGADMALDPWYRRQGVVMSIPLSDWAETLDACQGIIHFDAAGSEFLGPAMATISLGGCASCGSCPEEPAIFGQHDETAFPLLAPPPLHSQTVKEAQRPYGCVVRDGRTQYPPLILRCPECVRNRRCSTCNKWWCEACYQPPKAANIRADGSVQYENNAQPKQMGVRRECWECGLTCAACILRDIKTCRICQSEFCLLHNRGKKPDECDWCGSSGRRTRELY